MEKTLKELINTALREAFGVEVVDFVVEHPKELAHGDYATNAALVIGKQLGKNPREVAEALVEVLLKNNHPDIESISIAGAGFINFTLQKHFFAQHLEKIVRLDITASPWKGKRVMVEYTDPNPFKPFHIGHLMTNAIGESIARIIEISGGEVLRANYQGDVGLHVAKAIYGLQQKGMPADALTVSQQAQYIGECYVYGSEQYENDTTAKETIDTINKAVYERNDASINELYEWGRKVTLEAFEEIYKTLGTEFNYYFFESEMAEKGTALVRAFLEKGVFVESDGAIVFKAEQYNPKLHTRVFITSTGLPTYEAKELGLIKTKFEKEQLDQSIVITAVEQKDYMAVATEAMRQIDTAIAEKMRHITHGMMRFATGKMSSRKGNVITGVSLLEDAQILAWEKMKEREMSDVERTEGAAIIGVGAIKYAILRQAIGGDIIYDPQQSVSFEGDSGPYLQYTATRIASVIAKADSLGIVPSTVHAPHTPYEIEKVLYRFSEVVGRAATELQPHYIATFLVDVASRFNTFYANEMVADASDALAPYKLALVTAVHGVLVQGLILLGINVPEKM